MVFIVVRDKALFFYSGSGEGIEVDAASRWYEANVLSETSVLLSRSSKDSPAVGKRNESGERDRDKHRKEAIVEETTTRI